MNKINSLYFTVNIRRQASPPPPLPLLLLHQIKSMSMKNIASLSARLSIFVFICRRSVFHSSMKFETRKTPIKTCNLMRLSQLPVAKSDFTEIRNQLTRSRTIGQCRWHEQIAHYRFNLQHFFLVAVAVVVVPIHFIALLISDCHLCGYCVFVFVWWWTMTMIGLEYGGQLKTND